MKRLFIFLLAFVVLTNFNESFAQKKKKKNQETSENTAPQAVGKVLLRYNLPKGTSYTQSLDMDMNIEAMGMQIPQKQSLTMKVLVTDIASNGNQTHEATYEKIYMKQSSPMGDMEFDSDNPAKQPAELGNLKDIKGSKFKMIISPRGKIIEVQMDKNLPDASSQQNIEYPENPIGIGDSWTGETSNKNEQVGEIKTKTTYKLISINNEIAELEVKGKIYIDNKEQGETNGTIKVNIKTGLATESNVKQVMNMQMQGMEMKLDNTIKATTKM
ncbi:DUF6263 family protein [Raineya sp.]|jgi:hypothetical protein